MQFRWTSRGYLTFTHECTLVQRLLESTIWWGSRDVSYIKNAFIIPFSKKFKGLIAIGDEISLDNFRDRTHFYLSDGSQIKAEMMERTSYGFVVSDVFQFKGLTNDQNFKAIAVPYQVKMVLYSIQFIVSKEIIKANQFFKKLLICFTLIVWW